MESIVYVLTRENKRLAVLVISPKPDKPNGMLDTHIKFRVEKEGCIVQRDLAYEPAPVPEGTQVRVGGSDSKPVLRDADPIINCVIRDVELLEKDGSRSNYRITQHVMQ